MLHCFFCGEATGVALCGALPGDAKAPRALPATDPCTQCAEYMKQGIILIEVADDTPEGDQNPVRLGGWCVVRDSAISRIITPPELVAQILKERMAFVPHDAWLHVGLPLPAPHTKG